MSGLIQIKRSTVNAAPNTLQSGELAYSYVSNTLFIGDTSGNVITLLTNAEATFAATLNAAYGQANTALSVAELAYAEANAALPIAGGSITGSLNVAHDLIVSGNLSILGNTTTINTVALLVDENVIYLNANTVGTPVLNSYLTIVRGIDPNTFLVWSEHDQKWGWSDDGANVRFFTDAYNLANTANNNAVAAYGQANLAYTEANVAFTVGTAAYAQANLAYGQANVANALAQTAISIASLAYAEANSALPTSGGTITGSLVIDNNITVLGIVNANIDGGTF